MSFIPSDLNPGIAWFRAVPKAFSDAGITKAQLGVDKIYRFVDQINPNKYFEWINSSYYDKPLLTTVDGKIAMDFNLINTGASKVILMYMGGFPYPAVGSESTIMCTVNPQWSMSFWIKAPPYMGNPGTIFAESHNSLVGGPLYAFGNKVGATDKFSVIVRNGPPLLDKVSTTIVFDNVWHHIVITDDNGALKLYVDKVLDATDFTYVKPTVFTKPATKQAFGVRPQGTTNPGNSFMTKGFIGDNIVMDNKIWTAEDITNLYNYG